MLGEYTLVDRGTWCSIEDDVTEKLEVFVSPQGYCLPGDDTTGTKYAMHRQRGVIMKLIPFSTQRMPSSALSGPTKQWRQCLWIG